MGVIKEGRVSGTLPDEESFAVHFPGYPKTTARAIETLGGSEGILKTRSSKSNKLELYFRPEDPYSHPTFGELRPCNNLLLKISKKKSSNGQSAEASSKVQECSTSGATNSENPEHQSQVEEPGPGQGQTDLCADIVSRVSEAYHFDGMADYQHVLPVHAEAARRRKRNWAEAEEPPFERGGFMDVDQEDVMMLLPPLFSPKDMPENIVLRPSTILSSKKKQEGVVQNTAEVDLEPGIAIDFSIKDILQIAFYFYAGFSQFLTWMLYRFLFSIFLLDLAFLQIPKKVNWEELITRGSDQWEWQMTVSKLFDERPIWPKESVTERLLDKGLKFSHLMLKRLLLGVAYYFSNGPFLRFWIRKGYDPRKDPDSRIYQRTEFRVPEPLRSYADASTANKLKHKWEDLCSFRVFPYKCQTFLQLFELDDEYIQQEIRKPPKLATCNSKTGWFSESVLDCLRLRVAVRYLSVYPKAGAESILKSYSDEFEKLKRTCIYKDVINPNQDEHQQANKGDEEKERAKSSDHEEDEIEADDEEELDVYETLNLGGEDDEIHLQPDTCIQIIQSALLQSMYLGVSSLLSVHYCRLIPASCNGARNVFNKFQLDLDMENNSRTYLQELFGSFPSAAVGADAIQDADASDGEYQIYEHFSDNNYSDYDEDEEDS
ncbi:Transcription factor IIIC, subunit 5 [Corchorus olitorius]|uniref:Transcription factor IIIC, subunit 5 n=1 Tax=Corchorus olitorius TaxID=93759 RepID=A0A1R3JFE8_9ROSI|nr:Transcription factor IIIC, subunit 5 [Corchorus olitorius]